MSAFKRGRNLFRFVMVLVVLSFSTQLWASGWPPFGFRDSITVARGGETDRLTNGGRSVLDNDFDFERDELTAFLEKEPKHGSLILNEDGTFIYEHDGHKSDEDSFTYLAFDGTGFSRKTKVTIEVEDVPNSPPVVVEDVADQEAAVDVAYRLDLAGNFLDPDAGDELEFKAKGLPGSKNLKLDKNTGVLSGTPRDNDARDNPYNVEITATDRAGASAKLTFKLYILAEKEADIALVISLAANPVGVGETAQWSIEVMNRGPGELDGALLTANWTTSGPALTLSSPGGCNLTGNDTAAPEMNCTIGSLVPGDSLTIQVEGTQDSDGDNSLIGVLTSDDPFPDDNADLASSQVVAQFSEGPTQVINESGKGVDAGDLDGDGEIDIVSTDGQTLIYFNNGNRSVTTPGISLGSNSGGSAVTLLDWNGDGSLDIAVGGLAGSTAEIFINDGSGEFSSADRLQNGGVGLVNSMIAADLNNNGRSEVVIAGSSGTTIMRSRDQGGFEQTALSSGAGLNITAADIDLDGDMDIVVIRQTNRAVDIHYNNGNGTSFSRTRLNYGSVATVSAADLNGDGTPDLLLGVDGDDLNTPENKMYYQQANGSFSFGGSFGASPISALLSGDVNGDGWTDVVAVNEAGVHQLYLGSASNGFALDPEQIVSDGMRRGILSDFNSDDSLDLILVGREADVLEIHANNGIGKLGLGDRKSPDLRLIGPATVNLVAGESYADPGATAQDDIDGDITADIETSGTINPSAVGSQTITYSVADKAGNVSSAVRIVNIGVNSGQGGSGGGILAPVIIILLTMLAVLRRRMPR
ncbi:MAG: FG-GAP-like repeat-containing protein [Woeseiaceae bacterium]